MWSKIRAFRFALILFKSISLHSHARRNRMPLNYALPSPDVLLEKLVDNVMFYSAVLYARKSLLASMETNVWEYTDSRFRSDSDEFLSSVCMGVLCVPRQVRMRFFATLTVESQLFICKVWDEFFEVHGHSLGCVSFEEDEPSVLLDSNEVCRHVSLEEQPDITFFDFFCFMYIFIHCQFPSSTIFYSDPVGAFLKYGSFELPDLSFSAFGEWVVDMFQICVANSPQAILASLDKLHNGVQALFFWALRGDVEVDIQQGYHHFFPCRVEAFLECFDDGDYASVRKVMRNRKRILNRVHSCMTKKSQGLLMDLIKARVLLHSFMRMDDARRSGFLAIVPDKVRSDMFVVLLENPNMDKEVHPYINTFGGVTSLGFITNPDSVGKFLGPMG